MDKVLYNKKIDFCAFLQRPNERIIKMIYDEVKTHATPPFPSACPLREMQTLHVLYTVRRGTVNNVLYNRKIDFCTFLKRPTERIIKMIYDDFKRQTRAALPTSCPIQPRRILFTNISLNNVKLPAFLPQTDFEFQINIGLWLDVASGVLRTPLYNRTVDFCNFLRNPGVHRLGQIVHREMKNRGNMPTRCPIPPNLYQFRGVSLSHMRMPPFFVETDFVLDVNVGVENDRCFHSRWFGAIKKIKCSKSERCS
ncbi:AGAP010996-PA-like protein [Anopheles sinensis]|uniref:AGAP010996-PA-like protein n=1 Tax=Anopheles sinensis TaxID=74873 RepID=A0A084W988_ANOSI|nr:AGAP010996-PA-like protein [Anopheles sinensis]